MIDTWPRRIEMKVVMRNGDAIDGCKEISELHEKLGQEIPEAAGYEAMRLMYEILRNYEYRRSGGTKDQGVGGAGLHGGD